MSEKGRENRLRRMAEQQGLRLERSRRHDKRASSYGLYALKDWKTRQIVSEPGVPRQQGGFARAAGALNLPRLSARRRGRSDGLVMGGPGRRRTARTSD